MSHDPARRRALRAAGAALALGVAGCLGDGDGSTPDGENGGADGGGSPSTGAPDGGDGSGGGDGDGGGDGRPTVTDRDARSLDVGGSWTHAGSDAGRDGYADAPGTAGSGEVYWQFRRVRSGPPVLSDGRLFHYAKVGEDASGRPTVTRTREPDAGTAHPVYGQPALIARDASDGGVEWTAPLGEESRSWPAVSGDRVVTAVRGEVAARDAASGETLWSASLGEKSPGVPSITGDIVVVPIYGVVDGETYVHRPSIRAYSLADGAERWSVEPPHRSNGVAVASGTVVVVSGQYGDSGTVLGLSVDDGSEQWRERVPGGFFDLPVTDGETVYVTDGGATVRALAVADGSERWSTRLGGEPGTVATDGETVYAAVDSHVVALDAGDASRRWRVSPVDGSEDAVAVAIGPDVVYAGFQGEEAGLYALERADGSERWGHSFPWQTVEGDMVMSGVEAQPVVADGAVYVSAVDGLYAFGPG